MTPRGDQPKAISELVDGLKRGDHHQVLLGLTGSGKTFTCACVINQVQRPTLIIAHNKTLAAQLYEEFRDLFPENAVEYFVSYYDYYQPEAYVPASDLYIEKDSAINEEIDRMRHSAMHALMSRRDVIIVASVSCIYGIGDPEFYRNMVLPVEVGECLLREAFLRRLVELQYDRNDLDFHRGTFRVRGDAVDIFPPFEEDRALRIEWFGDEVEAISEIDPLRGRVIRRLKYVAIFPGSQYVTPADALTRAASAIKEELRHRLNEFQNNMQLVEAQRLEQRTLFDLEMLDQMGHCNGIENYSRHLRGSKPGEPPATLIDYFPDDFLTIVDESHQTLPQIRAMYQGDRSRKENLVHYGFRLPSALDNRPLQFDEWKNKVNQVIYVSATPGDYELQLVQGVVVEQIIRPTGLLDPEIEIRPVATQVDDSMEEIRQRIAMGDRILVTTLTKRMAEQLTEFYSEAGIKVRYLHSDVDTLDRIEILRNLRQGAFDVLVGINLLREGLDLPEVSLVLILDADKEGFLRAERSLIQTCGRAARNVRGKVIMYADRITRSMRVCIDETERRRLIQAENNRVNGIVPQSVKRVIHEMRPGVSEEEPALPMAAEPRPSYGNKKTKKKSNALPSSDWRSLSPAELSRRIVEVKKDMHEAAEAMDFERAAQYRDEVKAMQRWELTLR